MSVAMIQTKKEELYEWCKQIGKMRQISEKKWYHLL